jgi:DNA-binding beta-propeller fold protein YncE/tetratricopeptide (TPR) repeat protein
MSKFALILSGLLAAAPAAAYEKIEFRNQILNPAFMKISALAADKDRLYVADAKANCVFIFDAEGKLLGKAEGGLKAPGGLAFGEGRLYVADTGNSRIAVFDAEGKALWSFSGEGKAPGQLSGPLSLAYGPDGRVYAANTGNSRVEVFNSDGVFLYGFPTLKTDGVTRLNPVKIAASNDGHLYVSDPAKALVQKYDRLGKLVREYPLASEAVVPDVNGLLYAISAKEGKVRELSAEGEVAGTFGTRGKGKMEFRKLADIAVRARGELLLADEENKKVVAIHLDNPEAQARLPRAESLDLFTVKGPAGKNAVKADVFAVTPDGGLAAYLPDAKELALLSASGKKTLVKGGSKDGEVKSPRGIYIDGKGRIFVADTGNDKVKVFAADGRLENQFGGSGSGEGQFRAPSGVAVNAKGNVYVADTKNRAVKGFSPDGMFLFRAGPDLGGVTLQNPVDVHTDENRNVYVLDSGLKKVIVLSDMGKFLRAWDDSGSLQDPVSLVYDQKGYFYILDKGAFSVKVFDAEGRFAASFFSRGKGERELWAPQALAFSGDRIFISDAELSRVVSFDISYLPKAPAALQAEAGKKEVSLSWTAAKNAWTGGFKIYRADAEGAEPVEAGEAKGMKFSDDKLAPDTTYYYSAAGVSVSGMRGALSEPVAVYFKGPETPARRAADPRNLAPLEIQPDLNYVFSANYKHYLRNPVGRVVLRNNTDQEFSNVKVSFFLKDFMDFPTDTLVNEPLPAKSSVTVDIMATLNNRVLGITEDTPVQCQLTAAWYQDGAEKTVTLNKPIKMLSKNAIVWDKPARLANFITPKDTPVFGFSRFALNEKAKFEAEAGDLNENLVTALLAWEALGAHGLSYLADPVSPYSVLKSTQNLVLDTVQFPRSTLKLKSGDCDDLTALFAAVLEASGVKVALLDYPAHISMMFDTGATDPREAGLPAEYLIKYNNTYWVGLEVTMAGSDLYGAVKHAADFYRKNEAAVRVIEVRGAWGEFEPVTLPESSDENYPDREKFLSRAKAGLAALQKARYDYFKAYFGAILRENPEDADANIELGILTAKQGETAEAEKYFGAVLAKDEANAAALNNLGNVAFQKGDYEGAQRKYFEAVKADPYDGEIWLNLARAAAKLGKKDDVKVYAERAAKIDPSLKSTGDKLQ